MKPVGVGLVYSAELHLLLESGWPGISAVELEPETIWEQTAQGGGWSYRCNEELFERVVALPQNKLLHGFGHPIGGTADDPLEHWALLRSVAKRLQPAWASEHLSFNRVAREGRVEHAGFLLPPPQTPAGVRVAARNIDRYRRELDFPTAFETGVNYLRPREGEMDDGEFIAGVARAADCGILLDLHNLWCNQCNGRRSVAEVMKDVPLERVWEIHLAGGMQHSEFLLDGHCGRVPPALLDIASELVPQLPNLGALIFEILPEHLPQIGLEGVQREIERMQQLWTLRAPRVVKVSAGADPACHWGVATLADDREVAQWEAALVDALHERPISSPSLGTLARDPGCKLLGGLVNEFRRSSLAQALRYTITCLLAALDVRNVHAVLDGYFHACAPEPYAAVEAERFAGYLESRPEVLSQVPYLNEVLAFEHALLKAAILGVSSDISWSIDPTALFKALGRGDLPRDLPMLPSVMRIEST